LKIRPKQYPDQPSMGLYHPLDGVTNVKCKLLCFLTPNKKFSKRKALAFNWDRCCHLALCLQLILFHCYVTLPHKQVLFFQQKNLQFLIRRTGQLLIYFCVNMHNLTKANNTKQKVFVVLSKISVQKDGQKLDLFRSHVPQCFSAGSAGTGI